MAENTNRLNGIRFEDEIAQMFQERGWWVHNMTQNKSGQPADLLVVNPLDVYLLDCKVCKGNEFALSRIEPNQASAMAYWKSLTRRRAGFIIRRGDGRIFFLDWTTAWWQMNINSKKSIKLDEDEGVVMTIEDWFEDWRRAWRRG